MRRCLTCRFFDRRDEQEPDEGFCRRYPPVCAWDQGECEAVLMWPAVDGFDWCGEYATDE